MVKRLLQDPPLLPIVSVYRKIPMLASAVLKIPTARVRIAEATIAVAVVSPLTARAAIRLANANTQ